MAFAISICFQKTFSFLNCSTSAFEVCVVSTVGFGASRGATKTTTSCSPSASAMPLVAGYDVPSTTTRVATTIGDGRSDDTKNSYEPDRPVILNDQSVFTAAAIGSPAANCS